MEIPYTVTSRPDTGLYNAKLGMWLFLASEVMLFGGLFSAYIFLRLGTSPGYWPHGLLNVPIGTLNTAILVASSISVVVAWAALKMRKWNRYCVWMSITIILSVIFLCIKLLNEWPSKFEHYGIFIKQDSISNYEQYLGNKHASELGLDPRYQITGHLHEVEASKNGKTEEMEIHHPSDVGRIRAEGYKIESFKVALDPINAEPNNPANDRPQFLYQNPTEKMGVVKAEDVQWSDAFIPKHSSFLATYFTITGLHGLHVLGGILVFAYFLFFGKKLYLHNPEHMANRVEVAGLYWHFVDLVWVYVFLCFYLL